MPKPTKGPRLGGGPAHERLLLANLAAALFTHKSIKTTETKAKRLRPFAERLITFAKRGDLHSRRRVVSVIGDKGVVHELFTQIAPLVADREGGYTRITKLGFRKGDNASMVQIELVLDPVTPKAKTKAKAKAKAAPIDAGEDDTVVDETVVDDTVVDATVVKDAAEQSSLENAPEEEIPSDDSNEAVEESTNAEVADDSADAEVVEVERAQESEAASDEASAADDTEADDEGSTK